MSITEVELKCPRDGKNMRPYLSLLAPTYETFMCDACGGIFYDLVDQDKLQEIQRAVISNTKKLLKKNGLRLLG